MAYGNDTGRPGRVREVESVRGVKAGEAMSLRPGRRVVWVLLAWLAWAPLPATADPADTVGISSEARGTALSCVASGTSGGMAFYNPAGLTGEDGLAIAVSGGHVWSMLAEQTTAGGSFAELAVRLPLFVAGGVPRFSVGLAAQMPTDSIYRIRMVDDEDPLYPLYSPRERRLAMAGGFSIRPWDWIAVGTGLELLPQVSGRVVLDLADPGGRNEMHVVAGYRLRPLAGLRIEPLPWMKLGLSWRVENSTDLEIPAEVTAEGLVLSARVTAQAYYVPHTLSAGIAAAATNDLWFEAGLSWYRYGTFPEPSPDADLFDTSGTDSLGDTAATSTFHDVVSPALSVRWNGPIVLSGGYRFAPAALERQTGKTNLLDADRHTASLGAAVPVVSYPGLGALLLTADAAFSYLPERIHYKEEVLVGNPGYPSIRSGGWRMAATLGFEIRKGGSR